MHNMDLFSASVITESLNCRRCTPQGKKSKDMFSLKLRNIHARSCDDCFFTNSQSNKICLPDAYWKQVFRRCGAIISRYLVILVTGILCWTTVSHSK